MTTGIGACAATEASLVSLADVEEAACGPVGTSPWTRCALPTHHIDWTRIEGHRAHPAGPARDHDKGIHDPDEHVKSHDR